MERESIEQNKEVNTKPESIENVTTEIGEALKSPEKSGEFVDQRLAGLEADSSPKGFNVTNRHQEGFIHPDSEIKRNMLFDGFKVNDKQLYKTLMDTYKEFEESPNWKGKSVRDMTVYAIQYALGKYFGNHAANQNTESANREFYMDHSAHDSDPINLEELKGKNLAVCAEKSAAAQNMLSFVGADSQMILSESEINPGQKELHQFNVIKTSKGHFIFDPTNPQHNHNKNTASNYYFPALYPLDDEKYSQLMSGEDVEVEHTDYEIDEQGQKPISTKRIYGGLENKK